MLTAGGTAQPVWRWKQSETTKHLTEPHRGAEASVEQYFVVNVTVVVVAHVSAKIVIAPIFLYNLILINVWILQN